MDKRAIRLVNIHPVHPGRGAPSYIEAVYSMPNLKSEPIVIERIDMDRATELLARLAQAVNIVRRSNDG